MRKGLVKMALSAGVFVMLAQAPPAAQAATIQTFSDKATFLAATAATSATGVLPDLGLVVSTPAQSETVGSITFSLAPGGDNIAIGALGTEAAPDWYPGRRTGRDQ